MSACYKHLDTNASQTFDGGHEGFVVRVIIGGENPEERPQPRVVGEGAGTDAIVMQIYSHRA